MPRRHLPVHPDLDQLRHQAKDLLRGIRDGTPDALAELAECHPQAIAPAEVALADAQLTLARAYGVASWPRLVLACRMTDALHAGDAAAVRALVVEHPELLHEDARGTRGNWGPPLSYAANLGQEGIVRMLADLGATDLQHAFGRACLQGKLGTARWLLEHGARLTPGIVMGACETLNTDGLGLLLELGAELSDAQGDKLAPVALLLETYSRGPTGKHACLELCVARGVVLPDTPMMALHRGRRDLLEAHLARDPAVLHRPLAYRDIYPLELGCHADESLGLHGTPLAGATLLHACVDFDELEIAEWLLARGAAVDARATVDADGCGGHTPLFNAVVSQAHCASHRQGDHFARLLLDHGADPHARATIRKRLRFVTDESEHIYRDVTPLAYGRRFHEKRWVGKAALRLVEERGGQADGP